MKNDDVNFIIFVPPGLDKSIFPWGPQIIVDYMNGRLGGGGSVVDLRSEELLRVIRKHKYIVSRALSLLQKRSLQSFFGHTMNPYLLTTLMVASGRDFLHVCDSVGALNIKGLFLLKNNYAAKAFCNQLLSLKADFDSVLKVEIGKILAHSKSNLIGISVYDYTVMTSVYLATLIKEVDPESKIILGGDYIDNSSAELIVKASCGDSVDAVVVGYGEEVCYQVLLALKNGCSWSEIEIPGLVKSWSPAELEIVTPPFYGKRSGLIEFARIDRNMTLRVLPQRGCSWGECSFCTQIDRRRFFEVEKSELVKSIGKALISLNGRKLVRVSIDADENNIETLTLILGALDGGVNISAKFYVEFWIMSKNFSRSLAFLVWEKRKKIAINMIMNIETLDVESLKVMKKGSNILQAIEGIKVMIDLNQTISTNYFSDFPGQERDDVRREVAVLRKVYHLLSSKRVRFFSFPYAANGRDDIRSASKKISIDVARIKSDRWLSKVFAIDIPMSIWSYSYRVKDKINISRVFSRLNSWIVNLEKMEETSRSAARVYGGDYKPICIHYLCRLGRCVQLLVEFLTRREDYYSRNRILKRLSSKKGALIEKRAYLSNCAAVFCDFGNTVEVMLNDSEVDLLKFLYWIRTKKEIYRYFSDRFDQSSIDEMLVRLESKNILLILGQQVLCVLNDPAQWENSGIKAEGILVTSASSGASGIIASSP